MRQAEPFLILQVTCLARSVTLRLTTSSISAETTLAVAALAARLAIRFGRLAKSFNTQISADTAAVLSAGETGFTVGLVAHAVAATDTAIGRALVAALERAANVVLTVLITVSRAGIRGFRESACGIAAIPAIHLAVPEVLATFADTIAATGCAIHGAQFFVFAEAAHQVATHGTVGWAGLRTLPNAAGTIAAGRNAIGGANHLAFAKLAFAVAAGSRTVPRASLLPLVKTAETIAAAATIDQAILRSLPSHAFSVAARGQAVLGADPSIRTVLLEAAITVPAPTAVNGTLLGCLKVDAETVTAHPHAFLTPLAAHALALKAVVVLGAQVAVLTLGTVVTRGMGACPARTHVQSARVGIPLADYFVVFVKTARLKITVIVGTEIAVIATQRRTLAHPLDTMVVIGASVAVIADNAVSRLVRATRLSQTLIRGAAIPVVAIRRLVVEAVTVVVQPVAIVGGSDLTDALPQPAIPACSPSWAGPVLVRERTDRVQLLLGGVAGARTLLAVQNALGQMLALSSLRDLAIVAGGARLRDRAGDAAKPAHIITVQNASLVRRLTVGTDHTG